MSEPTLINPRYRKFALYGVGIATLALFAAAFRGGSFVDTYRGVTEIRYDRAAPLIAIVFGVMALGAAWAVRRRNVIIGVLLIVAALIVLVLRLPAYLMDRVTIDSKGFVVREGGLFETQRHDIAFDDVEQIKLVPLEQKGRHGRKFYTHRLHIHMRDGRQVELATGNLVGESKYAIMTTALKNGFVDQSTPPASSRPLDPAISDALRKIDWSQVDLMEIAMPKK